MRNIYLVKDVARTVGCSVYTVKYYHKLGLIKELGRSPFTNFRYFDEIAVDRLREVRRLRKQHLTLKEIQKQLASA